MLYKPLVLVKYVNVCVYWLSPVICILLLFLEIKLERYWWSAGCCPGPASEGELGFLPGDPGLCQQCWIVENKVEGEEEEEKRDHVWALYSFFHQMCLSSFYDSGPVQKSENSMMNKVIGNLSSWESRRGTRRQTNKHCINYICDTCWVGKYESKNDEDIS